MIEASPDKKGEAINPLMRMALDFGPILIFFIVNALASGPKTLRVLIATAAFMAATAAAMLISKIRTGQISPMLWMSGVLVLVFGGLTLYFQNENFIKMKPTIVNTLFGTVLLVGLAFGRPLLGYVFDSVFKLDDAGWRKLTFRWGLFFFVLAALNEVVWRSFSTDDWVTFKVFGILPLTILFTLTQMPLIQRHALPEKG